MTLEKYTVHAKRVHRTIHDEDNNDSNSKDNVTIRYFHTVIIICVI